MCSLSSLATLLQVVTGGELRMNYKGVDFEKRLSSVEEADKLLSELKACQVNAESTAEQLWEIRTACDRILRACNTQLAESRSCPVHFQCILLLAELACQGYTAAVTQRTPLYLEKILFHFMKNVAAQGAYAACSRFADLLYDLLGSCKLSEEHVKDFVAIAKSCFPILWKGADAVAKSGQWTQLECRTALCCRLRAVRFLVLLETKNLVLTPGELPSSGLTVRHAVAAAAMFEAQRTPFANEDVLFLSDHIFCLLIKPLVDGISGPGQLTLQQALCLIDLTVERCRMLCKKDCFREAQEAIKQLQLYLAQADFCAALALCRLGVELQQASSIGPLLKQASEVVRLLLESDEGRWEVLTESSQFFVSVIDRRSKKTEGADFVLADIRSLWSFLEQHCKLLHKQIAQVPPDCLKQQRNLKVQIYSRFQLYTAVIFTFFENAQDLKPAAVVDLLNTCTDTVTIMLEELDGLSEQDRAEYFNVTALCAFNMAYGLYNQKMYSESSAIMGVLCEGFGTVAPVNNTCMPVEKLHKYFRMHVESCRKAGLFQKASHSITLWLTALKDKMTEQMEDPVSLWVRVKMDAVKSGDEDMRLKTLKDCLAESNVKPLEPSTLLLLLSEELRAYKAVHADTGQERYNVICDMLEICSEDSELLYERAVNLVELAQVLCYHDYTNQSDCSALDSVQEALHLFEALPKTPGNTEQLMDDEAHALLWLFICTIEAKMQARMEQEQNAGSNQAQVKRNLQEFESNDLNYEDKLQEEKFAYEGIDFNLVADSGQSKCLDEALDLWKKLLSTKQPPKVRHIEQTVVSLRILGALYRLIGKPLQSIESFLLVQRLSDSLEDHLASLNALCHVAKTLFLLGCPSYAKIYVEEAESCLSRSSAASDTYQLMKLTCECLRSQLCCATGKVKEGVALLLGILKNPSLHKSSKAWYLLRSHILQLLASYLQLPPSCLSFELRQQLWEQGWRTPETALTDAHKLLRSIILLLLGNSGFTQKITADTRFVDQGDNLLQKWQVLGDLLSCSHNLVSLLSRVGSVSEAKAFCLEALKVCVMLQAVRQCAGFLVTKAELELQRTELEICQLDLQQVLFLLESGTVFKSKAKEGKIQIKLKKGKSLKKENPTGHVASTEDEGFLNCPSMEFVEIAAVDRQSALTSSPVLKSKLKKKPGFLSHASKCTCSLCSDLALSMLCIRWAMTFAEMQVASEKQSDGSSLLQAAMQRCAAFTTRFSNVLRNALSREQWDSKQKGIEGLSTTRLADGLLAQIYTILASTSTAGKPQKAVSDHIQAGLHFITSNGVQGLEYSKADLLLAKAVTSLYSLASKNGGAVADVFSPKWAWNPPSPCHSDTKKLMAKFSETQISMSGTLSVVNVEGSIICNTKKSRALGLKKLAVHLPDSNDPFSLDNPDTEIPTIAIKPISGLTTPVQKCFPAAVQPKVSFTVFNESKIPASKRLVGAPKASKKIKSRLKVVFSDESEPEDQELTAKPDPVGPKSKRDGPATRGRGRTGRKTGAENCKSNGRSSSNEPDVCSTVDLEINAVKPVRRTTRGQANALQEEMEMLRAIGEEKADVFEISFEVLRGSDGEDSKPAKGPKKSTAVRDGADGECEVLRRDSSFDLQTCFSVVEQRGANPFNMQGLSKSLLPVISASDVDAVYGDLKDAFNCVCHFPPSALYAQLCQFMVLCIGSRDPYTAAYLVSESVAVTTRHQLMSNIHRKLRKKKKNGSLDMSDQLQELVLTDGGNADQTQHLTQLENLFQFSCSGLNTDDFREQLQLIPKDVVVCLLTRTDSHPGAMGDTLLLTRLEQDQIPITVRLPTTQSKVSLSSILREFDAIQKEQKEVGSLTDKMEWWEGRSGLDRRMKLLIESLEHHVLGCWKGLLLPSCTEASVAEEACLLTKTLGLCGLDNTNSEGLLKAILNGSHLLSYQHVKSLALGLCQPQSEQAQALLQSAVDKLKTLTGKSSGHIVLVLDKHLQKLPWECLPSLIDRPVTRLPSLRFLFTYDLMKKYCPQSTIARGVNPDSTYYILNPHANLPGTEERFRDWFESESKWNGVVGKVPRPEQVQAALTRHDLYIYAGHGAGAHFLDGQSILKLDCNAVSLLFGCSSAALGVRGNLEGAGIILKYLIAGCPLVVGNLWDVTDRDIDRYMECLLKNWLKAGSGASILPYIAQSRRAPKLKYLIGAAPIAYGMPVILR